jgi:hypothetical protein
MRQTLIATTMSLVLMASVQCLAVANQNNVVFMTLDGVRWQELFLGTDPELSDSPRRLSIFTQFWAELAHQGVLFGDLQNKTEMEVSNPILLSLPAYQSIFAGSFQWCLNNDCGRIPTETLQERIQREFHLDKMDVASFASWNRIAFAVEHIDGATFVNAGIQPVLDPLADDEMERLNQLQVLDPPEWHDARRDTYTFAHALRYLKKHQPRFLYISLNDSDEWAHRGNYPAYLKTLRTYDQYINELSKALDDLGDYGKNSTLILATDHGRGAGSSWKDHGPLTQDSKYVWLFARSPYTRLRHDQPHSGYSHADIRPTIEASMGLSPIQCFGCGKPISEVVGEYPQ